MVILYFITRNDNLIFMTNDILMIINLIFITENDLLINLNGTSNYKTKNKQNN